MAWETFPYSYTSPYIHSWIFRNPTIFIFWVRVTHKKLNVNSSTWIKHPPTPTWPTPPHPCMTHPTPAWPTPPLHDTPHPTLPLHDPPQPTPPLHDTPHPPAWPTHPIPAWHTPPHPTPPHPPCMTHPTPPHDPPYPYMTHPTPTWPTPPYPTLPHPTPPLVHFGAQRSLFSWAASLCLPLGRQPELILNKFGLKPFKAQWIIICRYAYLTCNNTYGYLLFVKGPETQVTVEVTVRVMSRLLGRCEHRTQ